MSIVTSTGLWKIFEEKADPTQLEMVKSLCDKASQRLKLIRDTFPTYTLHDEDHSLNIIKQMELLLGKYVNELTTLEGALLMLSAYYHDIGMYLLKMSGNG